MLKNAAGLRHVGTGVLLIATALSSVAFSLVEPPDPAGLGVILLSYVSGLMLPVAILGLLHLMRRRAPVWRLAGWLAVVGTAVPLAIALVEDLMPNALGGASPGGSPLLENVFLVLMLFADGGLLLLLIGMWRARIVHGLVPLIFAASWVPLYLGITFFLLLAIAIVQPVLPFLWAFSLGRLGITVLRTDREAWTSHRSPAPAPDAASCASPR
ncbi:hypothetical protein GCM10010517_08930 [Streptosporangium fragile]|uniref:DUF4386 domain-containing protein n=1 Tax=Streptosporangium fragile TaxID=46186 RepID=A0ABN3VQU7_9ACTN